MKQKIFLPILAISILLSGTGSHSAAVAQSPQVETDESTYDPTRERPYYYYSIPELFEGIDITPEQQAFVLEERERFESALIDAWNQAYQEGRELTDADLQVVEDEYHAHLGEVLSSAQIEQMEENEARIGEMSGWKIEPQTVAEWQQADFNARFAGIELTSEEEQFVRTEIARSYETREEMQGVTNADLQALEDEFFARLAQRLSPEHIQQVRDNDERIAREWESPEEIAEPWEPSPEEIAEWQQEHFEYRFSWLELTPEQEQFIRAEIARDFEARLEIMDKASELNEADLEAAIVKLEDEFFARLEQGLPPEQMQQIRENEERLANEAATWEATPEQLADADFANWFAGIELTSELAQFLRTEITRYHEARYALMDNVDRVLAEGGDPEAEFQTLDNELVATFEQTLSPEQIEQVQENYPYLFE